MSISPEMLSKRLYGKALKVTNAIYRNLFKNVIFGKQESIYS